MYLVGLHIYYKIIHGPYNIKSVNLVGLHIYYKIIHNLHNVKSVYLVGLHIYYKMIHGPYNVKYNLTLLTAYCIKSTVYSCFPVIKKILYQLFFISYS